ncbi:translational GTPase TypA, partial [Candidatus Peregrinibacteria bacterium]|nr:translational GTPase TypA [Candidatus Peregrinibacteria bacterium]
GSEVERILRTVDATFLLVDAYEGPMPQTKFVLSKSLALGLPVMVVINKIDKPTARPNEVLDLTFDLFAKLGATDKQLDFPYIYTIAKQGIAILDLKDEHKDLTPLLDFIVKHVPLASADTTKPFRMQPATLNYNNYFGRMGVGRIVEGKVKAGDNVWVIAADGKRRKGKITKVINFEGIKKVEIAEGLAGDIVSLAGIPDIYVGETITSDENAEALPAIRIDPPAVAMHFMVNDSPFNGREGKYVTTRHIRDRLLKETETNVGLKVEVSEVTDSFKVYGRGEMHLAVLIENMRREGFELQVSQPQVVMQKIDGVECEPIEQAVVNVPEHLAGKIIELMAARKGELKDIRTQNGLSNLEFEVPTRGLLGFHAVFILITRGEGIMYHSFDHFGPYKGPVDKRSVGSMISGEQGEAVAYSLWKLQERGPIFVNHGTEIYEGMIIGEHNQGTDIVVNATKGKKLTNMRASGSDEAIRLTPPEEITLEKALSYIQDDEYVEVTPKSIRLRKKYLSDIDRRRQRRD